MILVAGTKRSGTSMWMQILRAAGFRSIGDPFPSNWGDTLRPANPNGFWESSLRQGIYFRTNPNPETGEFLAPRAAAGHAVKVFPFGVVRTDLAYIEAIVGTLRDWRSYDRSITALRALEGRNAAQTLPPWAEWWVENYELIRDLIVRRHRAVLQSYDSVVADPEEAIGRVLEMLGTGDLESAAASVKQGPIQPPIGEPEAPSEFVPVFDELFDLVHRRESFTNPFLAMLNTTHLAVLESVGVSGVRAAP